MDTEGWTRRRFVAVAGAAAAGLVGPQTLLAGPRARLGATAASADTPRFVSAPDLDPPLITVETPAQGTSSGLVFVAPFPLAPSPTGQFGGMIVDDAGEPYWFHPSPIDRTVMGLRVQMYKKAPVLTWYEGKTPPAYGGVFVIADSSYREIARIKAANGYQGDVHEFVITSRGTALIAIYSEVVVDLTAFGGAADSKVVEGIVQELALPSGRLLFEWHSLPHVPFEDSFQPQVTPQGNIDYFHLNSIGVDTDGGLLISARNTSTIYKLDRKTGQVRWRLGGKQSDFRLGSGAQFEYQHDARRHADGTLTLFDNGASAPGPGGAVETTSRPIRLQLDMAAMTATLAGEYPPPTPRSAFAMGNLQQLPDGGAFVGWGTDGSFSEIGPDGTPRVDARFAPGTATYRAFRHQWHGRPRTLPSVVVAADANGSPTAYVSWNGATDVAGWRLRTGASPTTLKAVTVARRTGFETAIPVPTPAKFVAVDGLDAAGAKLAGSKAQLVAL
jgi:hypothetical protein